MNKVICSTGAIIGRLNNNNYELIKKFAPKLNCDGFELMMSSKWYENMDRMANTVKSFGFYIPVMHSEKSLGESLCAMTTSYYDGQFYDHIMTKEEDEAAYKDGTNRFIQNIKAAEKIGVSKMVLHLWNGTVSDKNIEKNVERFGKWKAMAKEVGVDLLAENVICNTYSPIQNVKRVADMYDDAGFTYDTKMAEFHCETMKLFDKDYESLVKERRIRHLHVNDYSGGYMDWGNMKVLAVGEGHVDFDEFFCKLSAYGYDGDYTVEATSIFQDGSVDFDRLNAAFDKIRLLNDKYIANH